MISSASLLVIRSTILLLVVSPGTMAKFPDLAAFRASSFRSKRSLALRSFSSGPWHLKHLSERIGRISRLKSMAAEAAGLLAACAENPIIMQRTNNGVFSVFLSVMSQPVSENRQFFQDYDPFYISEGF